MVVTGDIPHEDANLAVVDLASVTTPLSLHPHGVRAALGEATGIEGDDTIGFAQPLGYLANQHRHQRPVVPQRGTDKRRFSRREIDSHSSRYASTFLQKYGHFCEVIFRPIGPIATPLLRGHHLIIAYRAGQSCPAGVCNGSPQWPGATEKIPHNVASESQ